MKAIRSAGGAIVLAMLVTGCAVPKQYMGIDTRTPLTRDEQVRVETALASASATPGGCPWLSAAASGASVPCNTLPLSRLAALATMDNKPALLELGIRFEEGRGVEQDFKRAELAYRLAAWTNTIQTGTQVAGVAGQHGRFEPIIVPGAPGLIAAEQRLAQLRARRKAK